MSVWFCLCEEIRHRKAKNIPLTLNGDNNRLILLHISPLSLSLPCSSLIVAVVVAVACAFTPAARMASRPASALKMSFAEDLPGKTGPLGFFDPAGFSQRVSDGEVIKYREAELKHGRVAMLACLGILTGEAVEFSTPLFGDKLVGPAIYQFQEADSLTGFGFAAFIITLIGTIETYGIRRGWETKEEAIARDPSGKTTAQLVPGYINGDLDFDPLGLKPKEDAAFALMQTKEINNGRLAMIGAAGMLVQELVTGKGILESLGLEKALPAAFDKGIF